MRRGRRDVLPVQPERASLTAVPAERRFLARVVSCEADATVATLTAEGSALKDEARHVGGNAAGSATVPTSCHERTFGCTTGAARSCDELTLDGGRGSRDRDGTALTTGSSGC